MNHGLSLVELLVVLGIIAILTAVVVPVAGFYYDKRGDQLGAREFYTAMKACGVYATTHNVPCAVAWNVRAFEDSLTGETRFVPTEYILARGLSRRELDRIRRAQTLAGVPVLKPEDRAQGIAPLFVALSDRSGAFTALPGDAALLTETLAVGQEEFTTDIGAIVTLNVLVSSTGMQSIRLAMSADDALSMPLENPTDQPDMPDPMDSVFDQRFPAYVWKPTGGLDVSGEFLKQRARVEVGLRPDQPVPDRFLTDPDTGAVKRDANGTPIPLTTAVTVFTTTGRVRVER